MIHLTNYTHMLPYEQTNDVVYNILNDLKDLLFSSKHDLFELSTHNVFLPRHSFPKVRKIKRKTFFSDEFHT